MNIALSGDVNESMALKAIQAAEEAKLEDSEHSTLHAMLLSDGGDVSAALAIYDAFQIVDEVIITATGVCCSSAASIILQAATWRKATPLTYFYIHDVKVSGERWYNRIFHDNTQKILNSTVATIQFNRMGYDNFKKAMKLGIFDSATALSLGFIDEVTT